MKPGPCSESGASTGAGLGVSCHRPAAVLAPLSMDGALPSETNLEPAQLPRHVAVIMDGNGRWAQARGLPRVDGHRQGADSVREVVREARRMGIKALTLYAFSAQNWLRPVEEVQDLMELLHRYVLEERSEIMDNQIRLTAIGDLSRLPGVVRLALKALMAMSASNKKMTLCLALSYGGQEDILHAARRLAKDVAAGKLQPDEIDAVAFQERLYSGELPEVDLLIRTSGEQRISNFLLWQAAYAEFYFTPTLWPEFRREEFQRAVAAYQHRERRFGLTSAQLGSTATDETPHE
jgi:undecaprenyl diphosphate synthase